MKLKKLIKNIVINLCLVFFGLLFSLLAFELILRSGLLNKTNPNKIEFLRPKYYYNEEGARTFANNRFEKVKPSDRYRIAVIGDSFTSPFLMQYDDSFTARLERMLDLNLIAANKKKAEVLNFGNSGYCTFQEVPEFKKALSTNPDLIILQITINDIDCNNFRQYIAKHPELKLGELKITKEDTPLLYYFKSLGFIAQRMRIKASQKNFIDFNNNLFKDQKRWATFKSSIREMKNMAKAKKVPFVAILVPYLHYPLDDNYPFADIHKQITEFLTSRRIANLDLFSAFKFVPNKFIQVLPDKDSHPNEIAHRIIADNLYEWLAQLKLIPKDLQIKNKYTKRVKNRG